MKKIETSMNQIGLTGSDIDAIFVTHEHQDHIKGLGVILRKYHIPVYSTYGTIDGIMQSSSLGTFDYNLLKPIDNNGEIKIKNLTVTAHPISHDAEDPVAYRFESENRSACIATDMGIYDDELVDFLSDTNAMLIEANHDVRMLEAGPYPYSLKQRIMSERGHLSNEDGGQLIRRLLSDHIKKILLGHLSKENNFADLALETVKCCLTDNDYSSDLRDFNLSVAGRTEGSELIEF